mmetsp:Transcript_5083/g.12738  ORF Transcript_5083/g.12738 Transcript_5083/m.12738 type:complete len:121 (-) Transcript_5083:253-615(-)
MPDVAARGDISAHSMQPARVSRNLLCLAACAYAKKSLWGLDDMLTSTSTSTTKTRSTRSTSTSTRKGKLALRLRSRVHSFLKKTATVVKLTAGAIAHGIVALVKFTAFIILEIFLLLLSR